MMTFNTRVAPSPTGMFHLGTARTAYHNWLMAKATGGKFIVRIDDTDLNRSNDEFIDVIYQSLEWLGLDYDITFKQSERTDRYMEVIESLLSEHKAVRDDKAIRLNSDFVLSQWTDFNNNTIKISNDDVEFAKKQVLIKSDGTPIYHFASIVDDIDYGINLVLRGADHQSNTSKQLFILNAITDKEIQFAHVGLIMHKIDGKMKKLSKRDNHASLDFFKEQGYLPESILNGIIRLGWAHTESTFDKHYPIFTKEQAVNFILDGNFKIKNATLDIDKLNFIDRQFKKNV